MADNGAVCFPDPLFYPPDPNGRFCYGGELTPQWLVLAYSHGIFPWFAFRWYEKPVWYCPMDRFVIFPREIHISHSMRTLINKEELDITFDNCFEQVVNHCSKAGVDHHDGTSRVNESGAWLGEDMIKAYTDLHDLGYAMSVETWKDGELIGGLYGVTIGHCFFGESMFSLKPNSSKMALIALAEALSLYDDSLIDCQFETPHLLSMGGRHISYEEYMTILRKSIGQPEYSESSE